MFNKKLFIFCIICSSIFIIGCSGGILGGGGSTPIGPNDEEDVGDGLQARIQSFDSSDLALTQGIYFTLDLQNSNLDSIELQESNIKIRTIPSDSSNSFGTIFSDESISNLYEDLFSNRGSIFISDYSGVNQDLSLSIQSPKHTSDNAPYLNSNVNMFIDINYDEEFEYSSNMLTNFDSNSIQSSLLTKKGPFDLQTFELRNSQRGTILRFEIIAQLQSLSQVEFRRIETQFGRYTLDCSYTGEDNIRVGTNSGYSKNTLTNQNSKLIVICEIPQEFSEQYGADDTQFTFSTTMDYTHEITLQQSFKMPQFFSDGFE